MRIHIRRLYDTPVIRPFNGGRTWEGRWKPVCQSGAQKRFLENRTSQRKNVTHTRSARSVTSGVPKNASVTRVP